jgi:hypothetical protein
MIVDLFLVYQFIRRLATPFKDWDAYKLGIIDADGNILKKARDLRTVDERKAWGKFDLMITKLKRLLAKVPGGSSRIASYAAALYLIKESEEIEKPGYFLNEEQLESKLAEYMSVVQENRAYDDMFEDAIANAAGNGDIAGIGIGPDGEPGVTKSAMRKYKKKKEQPLKRFKDTIGTK